MASPATSGLYQSRWTLVTSRGAPFGDSIWCIIPVEEGGTLAVTQMIDRLWKKNNSFSHHLYSQPTLLLYSYFLSELNFEIFFILLQTQKSQF